MSIKRIAVASAILAVAAGTLVSAQPQKGSNWTGRVAFGPVFPVRDAGDVLEWGWAATGGGTYRPETWPVAIFADMGLARFRVKGSALEDAGLKGTNGHVQMASVTGGITWAPRTEGVVGWYLSAGAGLYMRRIRITEPTEISLGTCDPYFPGCFSGSITVDETVGTHTEYRPGANAGIGITFKLYNDTLLYVEARYHWVDTENVSTDYVPVVLGWWF